ncbi:MAG: hypothetical protein K8R02_01585 [Anaerohalosphaeraceae bacterium]|nr:hypothetical protein [Anaerohalosphaeraceae bacterium]
MIMHVTSILASFVSPVDIGTTPQSLLLALPLIAVIAVVYKATKLEEFTFASFVKESAILFGSISVFMILAAVGLYLVMQFTVG